MENTEEEKIICYECGAECTDNYYQTEDGEVCEDCRFENYVECCKCGEIVHQDNCTVDNDGDYYCDDCASEYLETCWHCGEVFLKDSMYYCDSEGEYICQGCYEDHYFTCEECEEVFPDSELVTNDCCCYCTTCYEHVMGSEYIHEYDYKPEPVFSEEKERDKKLHIGVELEVQTEEIENKKPFCEDINSVFDENDIYLKYDGSLNDCGIEIVSMPMTFNYMKENNIWGKIFNTIYDYPMDINDECGLHFHIDKKYLDNKTIQNIDFMVNAFDTYFAEIGGREFNSYCSSVKKSIDDFGKSSGSRYLAVNLTNRDTVELRFCRSTDNFETFMERLKAIIKLVEFAKVKEFKDLTPLTTSEFEKQFESFDF